MRASVSEGVVLTARRVAPSTIAFLVISAAVFAFLLHMARGLTFYWDEWAWIISHQPWSFATFMDPYNEHWTVVPLLVYKTMLATVGLSSYLPYLAVLLLLHVATAAALFTLVRRLVGPLVALAVGSLFLLFGVGYENLVWGAGISYLCAVAPGAWALVLVLLAPERHPRLVALLLLVSVAAQGIGLFFLAAVGVVLLLTPEGRRRWWQVLPAAASFGVWFAVLGHAGMKTPITLATIAGLPRFIFLGAGTAAESVFGLGTLGAVVLVVGLGAAGLLTLRRPGARAAIVAAGAGLLAQFVLIGLTRDADRFGTSRYQYVAAVFVLIGCAGVLSGLASRVRQGERRLGDRGLGDRGLGDRRLGDRVLALPMAVLALVSIAHGLPILYAARNFYLARADATRALITLQLEYGGSPALPADLVPGGANRPSGLLVVGSPDAFRQVVALYGSPLTDALYGTTPISAAALDGVLFQIVRPGITVAAEAGQTEAPVTVQVDAGQNASVSPVSDSCAVAQPTGPAADVMLAAPGGALVHLTAQAGGDARLSLSRHGTFADEFQMNYELMPGYVDVPLTPGVGETVSIPDIGDPAPWLVRIELPDGDTTRICLTSGSTGAAQP